MFQNNVLETGFSLRLLVKNLHSRAQSTQLIPISGDRFRLKTERESFSETLRFEIKKGRGCL
jgi:hypothetical protein